MRGKKEGVLFPDLEDKYQIVYHDIDPKYWAIKIVDGKYKGLFYSYGQVELVDGEDGLLRLQFEQKIHATPEGMEDLMYQDTPPDLLKLQGDILSNCMYKGDLLYDSGKGFLKFER